MVIEYDTTTFEIRAIHYGMVYNASDWSGYDVSDKLLLKVMKIKIVIINMLL